MVRTRRIVLAVVTLLLVMAAVPQLASAKDGGVPFHARLVETVVAALPCPLNQSRYICVTVTGSGHATHLGAVTESMVVTVDTQTGAPACGSIGGNAEVRRSTLTAANGDAITLEGPGYVCNGNPGISHDSWVVTDGTGRFDDATGHGTDGAIIDRTNLAAVTSVTIFDGALSR